MNRVVHFEIPSDDPAKSLLFYETVFGWKMHQWAGEEYWLASTGREEDPGIHGAIMKKKDARQPVVNTIAVADLEQSMELIGKNGGQIVVPKTGIPGVGWLAYFKDPDGNIFGIMQNDPAATV